MALDYTIKTFVCQATACPDLEDALTVVRGDVETGDILGEIENDFSIQFDLRGYAVFVAEAMEETRDQLLRELPAAQQPTAEATLNLIIDDYTFKVSQWLGSANVMIDPNDRQRIWDEIAEHRNDFVVAVNRFIDGAASAFERDLDQEAADARKRFVVAFITDPEHDPVFIEGVEDPFISTDVGNQNYAREGIIVHPSYIDRGGEGQDSNLVTVIAEICTPDLCPEPADIESVFEYTCREDITGNLERRPTLTIEWKLPDCCPVAFGVYEILEPPPSIVFREEVTFIGGNASYQWVLWPGRGFFITQHVQNLAAVPMPGATALVVEARDKEGTVHAAVQVPVRSQQMLVTTIATITGEGDDRVIKVTGVAGDFKPTDFFDYVVGEEVIVFGAGQDLELPLNADRSLGGNSFRIIPANFGGYGV